MSARLLSRDDLKAKGIDYSPSQLHRKMKDGSFPVAIKGGGKANRWLETEIDSYVSDLLAARTPRPAESKGVAAA
jgi:predicted DNA-binding transcriptional regulator AlpA